MSPRFDWERVLLGQGRGLRTSERLIALMLATYANKVGEAWPSVATIADQAECDQRTVQRALRTLQRLGWLAPVGGSISRGGPGATTRWRLTIPEQLLNNPDTSATVGRGRTVTLVTDNADTGVARPGHQRHPNMFEHSKNSGTPCSRCGTLLQPRTPHDDETCAAFKAVSA